MSIDGFCQGYHGVGRKRVLPTPHAWERVAGFGAVGKSSPLLACAPDLRREVGVVLRMKTGVLARLIPGVIRYVYRFISQLAARSVCRRFVSIFLLCAGWSLKWASLQDRLGCFWCAAARFPLAGLQHSSYRFVGRLMSELTGNSSGKMLDVVSRDMRRTIECCGRALRRGLSGAVEPVSKHHIIKNECVHF